MAYILCAIGITFLFHGCSSTFTLSPSSVSACPDQMVKLSCSSTESTFTTHSWTIRVPGCLQLITIVRDNTINTITETAIGTSCPSGIEFQLMRVSESPFISNLTTTTALNGTIVTCGNNAATSSDVRITITVQPDRPDRPDGVMTSQLFNSGNVAVTLQWNNLPEVSYNVSVTPRVSAVMMTDSSATLTVMYNIRYSVSIAATNCAGESAPYITELYYVDCGNPTIGSNVVVEGVVPPRVAQGTNVTFKCQSGQSYILTGPAVATCSSSGLWEPDTSAVQCIANCGHPNGSRNVQVMYNSTLEGATVVFKCNEGFSPNVTRTGICLNNSMWYRDPADLVCVNPFGVDCGSPSPPAGGSITSLTGTLEGSRVTFICDNGSLEMDAECQPDGNWEPNPAQFDCTQGTTSSTTSSIPVSASGLSSGDIAAIIVVLVIVVLLSPLFAVVTAIVLVLIRRRNNSVKKSSSEIKLQSLSDTPVVYSTTQHPGPRANQILAVQTDTLVYAGLDLPAVKKPLISSLTSDDSVATGYADINFTAMNQPQSVTKSSGNNQEPADDLLNLDSLLIQLKPEVTSKWDQFARVIGLSEELMKDLSSCGPDDRMVEMLDYWLRHHPSKPTWRDIAQILEEIHLYQLAGDLLKVYETGELPVPFDMNEVPEGTLPRNEPPPPLPPKIADFDDGPDLLPLTDLPPKPPLHRGAGSSMRAPPPIPPPYHDNGEAVLPPSRPPKSNSRRAPPRPPKSVVDADVPARPPKPPVPRT